MGKPYRILISGYYGFNNIGDDSILTAVTDSLRNRIPDIEITALSQSPESTSARHGVSAVSRKSPAAIFGAARRADLLISGGGSLLQDVTSKKSIIYYLAIMWLALLLGKKFFIYSQGIGPINSNMNRRLTAWTLKKAAGIVVRDEDSKDLLSRIGVPEGRVIVTADPVLRVKRADLSIGRAILEREGVPLEGAGPLVGMAIREPKVKSEFVDELCASIERLGASHAARVALIPFHFSEDLPVALEIESRLGGRATAIKNKYLTEEMLSIIGNMDVLTGVRLHSLIYAAVMGVPMIAVSYDPKVNAFMHSLEMKALSLVKDFSSDYYMEEFDRTLRDAEKLKERIGRNTRKLVAKLDANEEMIRAIIGLEDGREK
ncbi:MAG: polysaccharide pyruvyl transferase CsaB [Clostridiales Family XIII bacterium]|jgi:polysaccharide pyruvyl transferase CsaB|nr:polysaccharide pyruvyl transferase CsaB [Clostridiales Family XIII bacterium]